MEEQQEIERNLQKMMKSPKRPIPGDDMNIGVRLFEKGIKIL